MQHFKSCSEAIHFILALRKVSLCTVFTYLLQKASLDVVYSQEHV